MKNYESYQHSGLDWLGEIPSHWEVKKLKQVAESVQTGFTPSTDEPKFYEEGTVDWFAPSDFGNRLVVKEAKKKITSFAIESGNARYFKPNSVLLVGIGATLGKVGLCETACSANQQINAIGFKPNYDPHFATYYLKAISQIIVSSANASTLPILNQTGTKELYCVCPPLPEQRAIAAYLDRKTAQLDTLLAQKEALLQKLHQKRQALINEAVTQGLNPEAPRKASGVAWLGHVPAHWEVKKLKYVASLNSGNTINAESIEPEGAYPVLGGNGLRGYTTTFTHDGHFALIGRQGALCGNINYGNGQFFATEHALVVSLKGEYETVWLGELLRIMNLGQYSQAAAQPGLSAERLMQLSIPVPPLAEQRSIVNFIEAKANKINDAATAIHIQIQTLKAYRQSLITEVVTGKVDVRPTKPAAPEADLPLWMQ